MSAAPIGVECVTDEDACEELDHYLDDHSYEKVAFVRDDGGNWYAQTSTHHGYYSSQIWWRVLDRADDLTTYLNDICEEGRRLGAEP
jgi:hypothetical protein